jgi:hypothetical protein
MGMVEAFRAFLSHLEKHSPKVLFVSHEAGPEGWFQEEFRWSARSFVSGDLLAERNGFDIVVAGKASPRVVSAVLEVKVLHLDWRSDTNKGAVESLYRQLTDTSRLRSLFENGNFRERAGGARKYGLVVVRGPADRQVQFDNIRKMLAGTYTYRSTRGRRRALRTPFKTAPGSRSLSFHRPLLTKNETALVLGVWCGLYVPM